MERATNAVNFFHQDNNCAQSVLYAFSKEYNFNANDVLRLASGFGGGIGLTKNICGAVSGGVMALGLAGNGLGEDKAKTYARTQVFLDRFTAEFGTLNCGELLKSKNETDSKAFCNKFIEKAVCIIEDIVNEK